MISKILNSCAVAALLGSASGLLAQEVGPPSELVDALTQGARVNLPNARLPDGSNVSAETPEELASPIVSRDLEIQTIERALLSAAMETCALNSTELSFLPYIGALRDSEQYSDKQLAYIGVLHGFSMAWLGESLDSSICSDEFSAEMIREARMARVEPL